VETTLLLVVAALCVVSALLYRAGRPGSTGTAGPTESDPPAPPRTDEALELIRALPGLVVLLEGGETVSMASPAAEDFGLVRRDALTFEEIAAVARRAAATGGIAVAELYLHRPPLRKRHLDLRVRAIPLRPGRILLLIDDLTEERRVEAVRRDFVANVSHELKTPVGAISLLAEALMSAASDPADVEHFAIRMLAEAERLANLINDVIDLSRLQGEDPLTGGEPQSVDSVVAEAVDHLSSAAEARGIRIFVGGPPGLMVFGMRHQLVTAVRNLLANAIAYSPEHTNVAVAVRARERFVEIAVKDQGIGIAEAEQSRIFERFYRVDGARSRITGGTGLGLAIVRNVCRNHGGDVAVWSVPGEGSTFTVQLPCYEQPAGTPLPAHDQVEGVAQ